MTALLMDSLLVALLLLVAAAGTIVVLTREPGKQAIVLAGYGTLLGVLMLALQAPDVAMSQLAVGSVVLPLLVVLTITKVERDARRRTHTGGDDTEGKYGAPETNGGGSP
jgi:energy-converting hydrogenase B subunit D